MQNNEVKALNGLDLVIHIGEFVAVVGTSGSEGKKPGMSPDFFLYMRLRKEMGGFAARGRRNGQEGFPLPDFYV